MIKSLLLTAALIPAASIITDACSPPPPVHVQADCTALDGSRFTYDGPQAGMPAGCTVIGSADVGTPLGPVTASQDAPGVTFNAGGGHTGTAGPVEVLGQGPRPDADTRVIDCPAEHADMPGARVQFTASAIPAADLAADLANGICTIVAS